MSQSYIQRIQDHKIRLWASLHARAQGCLYRSTLSQDQSCDMGISEDNLNGKVRGAGPLPNNRNLGGTNDNECGQQG